MKCPVCAEQNLKSSVHPDGFGAVTAMYCAPWYDEEGRYHKHDMNTHTRGYSCSLGHRWVVSSGSKCPSCEWQIEESVKIETTVSTASIRPGGGVNP